jgi:predicted secreted protein
MKYLFLFFLLIECQTKQSNNSKKMNVGETIKIELEGHSGSGYSWEYTATPNNLLEIEHDAVYTKNQIGGKNTEIFSLKALKKGKLNIQFNLRRSWEKDKKPIDTKSFDIEIN